MCRPVAPTGPVSIRASTQPGALFPSRSARLSTPAQRCFATRRPVEAARTSPTYQQALELARGEQYDAARAAFAELVAGAPSFTKAWVSWAQMEKRCCRTAGATGVERFTRCREVLQRAMTLNPKSAELTQAWGLMELQKGNAIAAVKLLERSAAQDPRNQPVLRWKPVLEARSAVLSMRAAARRAR